MLEECFLQTAIKQTFVKSFYCQSRKSLLETNKDVREIHLYILLNVS